MTTRLTVVDRGHELSGRVHDEESLLAAAARIGASLTGPPAPVDLSGEIVRFAVDHDHLVTLRAMTHGDLPLVTRWRQQPHVHRWWTADGEPTLVTVTAQYADRIDGTTPTRMWIAEVNGRSVGFVQDYRVGDYPDYALLAPEPAAIGFDYAIGEPEWVGRGLGVRIVWAWMLGARKRFPDAGSYFAAPDHRNEASLRLLHKVGFVRGLWFDEPRSDGGVDTVVGCTLDVARVLGAPAET